MSKRLLVLQHVAWEGPGRFLREAAAERRVVLDVCHVYRQPLAVNRDDYDGFLLLGGGPNVDEEDRYPFLRAEKRFIREVVAADRPVLAICLGHQLLAEALGARIGRQRRASVGFIDGRLCEGGRAHPLFAGVPERLPLFKWHGYAVQMPLPAPLEWLATSPECEVEAFSVRGRPHICGLQFDNHAAHPEDVALWVREDARWLASLPELSISPQVLIQEATARLQVQQEFSARLMGNFFKLL